MPGSPSFQPFILAIHDCFGTNAWRPGDASGRARTKNAAAEALGKAKKDLRSADLKNLVYDLWHAGMVELVPPRNAERSYRIRLSPNALRVLRGSNGSCDDSTIEGAYMALRREKKSTYVYFNDLALRCELPIASVHDWALKKARAGQAELSEGDYSLAYEDQRSACFEHKGKRYLMVGIVS